MSTSNQNKVTRQVRLEQIITGIEKHFSTTPAIDLAGTSYTATSLVALLQKGIDAAKQTSNTKAAWLAQVQSERNTFGEMGPVLRYIKTYVTTKFGDTQDAGGTLADFGYTPRKSTATGVAVKAEAAVKNRATRVARGTKGSKQKAKIKGASAPQPSIGGSGTVAPATAASNAPAQVKPGS